MIPLFGKFLILLGIALILAGVLTLTHFHVPWLGRLPGDITIKRETLSFYFPLTTCILVSALATLVMTLFRK